MKTILTMFFSGMLCSALAQAGTVVLSLEGVDLKKGGQLSAGIFRSENFPKVGKQLIGTEVQVSSIVMRIVLRNVPPGAYGAAVFQDVDENKDLETNFVGMPKEPIGFSNDARIKLGPPAFDDAKFIVKPGSEVILKIILR